MSVLSSFIYESPSVWCLSGSAWVFKPTLHRSPGCLSQKQAPLLHGTTILWRKANSLFHFWRSLDLKYFQRPMSGRLTSSLALSGYCRSLKRWGLGRSLQVNTDMPLKESLGPPSLPLSPSLFGFPPWLEQFQPITGSLCEAPSQTQSNSLETAHERSSL